ncbi:MAG: DNA-binding protein Tfx [Methanonatronarchaeales archaeon]|nr:DNA-binding protein Tfx [Methanonatronarchaeales archaeon]
MAKPFLTERQLEVLRLREQDLTQREVAERLETSRSNVSLLERRGRENVERARATLDEWRKLTAEVVMEVEEGADLFEVPRDAYRLADERGIKVEMRSLEMVSKLREKPNVTDRLVKEPFRVLISPRGEVSFDGL